MIMPPLNHFTTNEQTRVLVQVAQAVAAHTDLSAMLRELAGALQGHFPDGYISFALIDQATHAGHLQYLEPIGHGVAPHPDDTPKELSADQSPTRFVWNSQEPFRLDVQTDSRFPVLRAAFQRQGVKVACFVPLSTPRKRLGAMGLVSYAHLEASADYLEFTSQIGRLVALAVEATLTRRDLEEANRRTEELSARLRAEKEYLEEELRTEWNSQEMIGGAALRDVLRQVEVVATTDSSVLIEGETGTGKELVARAVHRRSRRKEKAFVKLNCAAIPTGLLESELFGAEKGAFTGANERRMGRFELANGGTLFLDEVGDIPLELQPKLLRVLQEQEFERLGSVKTIKVDVRLIAATHRNLKEMAALGAFRSDLYYRLHVFPIRIPSLRERRDDIAPLARHFARMFARRFGKEITSIPQPAIEALQNHPWPGNVRELEHLIERAVILTPSGSLQIPTLDPTISIIQGSAPALTHNRLEAQEREMIVKALHESAGVVGGPQGAAAKLGLKRTTLLYRMKKYQLTVTPSEASNI